MSLVLIILPLLLSLLGISYTAAFLGYSLPLPYSSQVWLLVLSSIASLCSQCRRHFPSHCLESHLCFLLPFRPFPFRYSKCTQLLLFLFHSSFFTTIFGPFFLLENRPTSSVGTNNYGAFFLRVKDRSTSQV